MSNPNHKPPRPAPGKEGTRTGVVPNTPKPPPPPPPPPPPAPSKK